MNHSEGPAAVPSGVVTFLFTDIEGSTRRWEADADAMRHALEAHDQVSCKAVEMHHGWLFKHTGDGMCAAFSSPMSAVDAAVAAQRELQLPVRMGIATGEAELRGADYFGAVLNRASRVMSCGHGGQILLDGATAGLLSSVDLIALGPRRLRDLVRPVEIFQVRASGLRSEFPSLRTLDATPGNLRPQSTSFVGRESELSEVTEALTTHRLVTLTGVGGVGKTRLALEAAARSMASFPDGVWVIELAAVVDPAAVPEAVAAVLGITQQPGLSVADSVAAAQEGRIRLLVFDNCEHVLDAAAEMIQTILQSAPAVRIIATSREGLRVSDEQLWPVASLDVKNGIDSTAAALFVERVRAVAPDVSWAGDDEAAAVEICCRLDGIPLGIELAASRLQSMTVTELRDRLDDRFRLLVGSRRGLERHQTLRHAVQWSHDLLDDDEKLLLARCSVFAGGFDLHAAGAVAGYDDEFATLDLLDALVRKSLVVADRRSGRTRFSMLETIRQFAEEQLVAVGKAEEARAAHARYFAGREADVLALWDSPRQRDAYAWFAAELANLRAAFRWSADHSDIDTAAAIAVYVAFLGIWVEQYEPLGWAEELIECAKSVRHRRLAQLYVMAAESYITGRVDSAVCYADAGLLAIASGQFDKVPFAFEAWIGGGYIAKGQPERWVDSCRNIVAREQGIVPHACLALALNIVGAGSEARAISEDLLEVDDATGNPLLRCLALLAYGVTHREADPIAAYDVLRQGLRIAQESGNEWAESHLAASLSRVAATRGNPADALEYLDLAIRAFYDAGSFSLLSSPLAILAGVLDTLGYYEPAATISAFASNPWTRSANREIDSTITHLREVFGAQAYQSMANAGEHMTDAAMAAYALDQIDRARTQFTAGQTLP